MKFYVVRIFLYSPLASRLTSGVNNLPPCTAPNCLRARKSLVKNKAAVKPDAVYVRDRNRQPDHSVNIKKIGILRLPTAPYSDDFGHGDKLFDVFLMPASTFFVFTVPNLNSFSPTLKTEFKKPNCTHQGTKIEALFQPRRK